MGKKSKQSQAPRKRRGETSESTQGSTLKDLLHIDTINKLKAQAAEIKQAEQDRNERQRKQEEEARKQEQKLRESDFAYLLENSDQSWSKYK